MAVKFCKDCKVLKPATEFFGATRSSDGLYTYCKSCGKIRQKRWAAKNQLKNKTWQNRKKFGLTQAAYVELLESQKYVCAVCKKPETVIGNGGKVKALAVDHNHDTGVIRGLLCQKHNQALGLLQENFDTVLSLAKYILEHNNVI